MLSFRNFIQENWFETNDNRHLKRRETISHQLRVSAPTKVETGAIKRYIKNSRRLNTKLISGESEPSDAKVLDKFIERNRLPVDLHTYSAVAFDPKSKVNVRGELTLPSFLSTSPHKDVVKGYTTEDKDGIHHIAHIILKKGDPATHIGTHEDELILGRGRTLKYHGSTDVEEGDKKYRIHKMSSI